MVHPQTIALGIAIGEEASLKHLVRGEADPVNDIGRIEGGLLNLGEKVFRIAVEFENSDITQRT